MAGKQLSGAKRTAEQQGGKVKQRRIDDCYPLTSPGARSAQKPPKELVQLLGKNAAAGAATGGRATRSSYGLASPLAGGRQLRSHDPAPPPAPATKAAAGKGKAPEAAAAKAAAAGKGSKAAGGKGTGGSQARAAAAAASSKGGSKGSKGGKGGACAARRRQLSEATLDGETFAVGESVYVVLDTAAVADLDANEDEECACVVCGGIDKEEEAGPQVMLECDRCLSGCHMGCCAPPLHEVPEGEWVCPECTGGRSPGGVMRARRAGTARERFLQRQGLGLARIEALWQEPGGDVEAAFRWYCVPEETHTGRQRHHLAREVFLTQQRDANPLSAAFRRAHVLPPREFQASGCSGLGEDVYVCEYLYDSAWQRFRRRTEFDSESEDEGEDWAPEGGSDSEGDEDFQELPLERAGGARRARGGKHGGGGAAAGGINRRKGLEDNLAQVGALAVPERARARARGPQSALAQARSALTLTAVPKSLPCREAERAAVAKFVEDMLRDGGGKCMYVSGIPGTGKTATVLEVMRAMKRRSEAGEVPPFQFVELNGLRLPSPQHAYSALYEGLTGDRAGSRAALEALEQLFSAGGGRGERRTTIVLVDELDLLVNKAQTVLYNLFEWPGRKHSRLAIISIANTMDLPERLHPRIGSRLAHHRLVFQPYTRDQLQTIIRSRLEGVAAFQPNAVQFVATRIANNSGDVRRCLELGRRAAEIAEERLLKQQRQQQQEQQQQQQQAGQGASSSGSGAASAAGPGGKAGPVETGMVEMRHVGAAIAEMFSTGHVRMVREACRLERLLLAATYIETASSGRAECVLADAWERLRTLCHHNCEPQYDFGAVVLRAADLGAKRLIICDAGARRVRTKVALNVAATDLLTVLGSDPDMPWLEAALGRAATAPVAPDMAAA